MTDFKRRLDGLQARMEEKNLDLVVLGASPDFQYITGTSVEWRKGRDLRYPADTVFVPKEGAPIVLTGIGSSGRVKDCWITDCRSLGMFENFNPAVKDIVKDLVDEPKRIGIGEYTWGTMVLSVASNCPGTKFKSAEGLMDDLRKIKDSDEIKKLRAAAKLTDEVMEIVIEQIDEGDSMRGTQLKIESKGKLKGASDISFPPTSGFVKTGGESGESVFNYDKDAPLEEGTSIAFDIGFVLDGYCSDWGRSMYYGKPEKHVEEAYHTLQSAVVETIDNIGDDIKKVNDLYPSIEKVCDREGYGDYLRARLTTGMVGHQIGVEVHEDPWLKPDEHQELVDGMVFCVEPKLWNKGQYYLRVEDMILIKNGKAESLTTFDRAMFQI